MCSVDDEGENVIATSWQSICVCVYVFVVLRRDGHVGSVEDEGESGSVTSWQSISSTPSGSPQQSRRQLRSDYADADIETG